MADPRESAQIAKIKRLAIIAMFSDDSLMNLLVLKGGNALDIVYDLSTRSSLDLDFSIAGQFPRESLPDIERRIRQALEETFRLSGYQVFDFRFAERPEEVAEEVRSFWGGYRIEFKVIETAKGSALRGNRDSMRRNAAVIGPRQQRTLEIEISKYEYVGPKQERELDHYTVFVYSPAMLVIEKLRAICQQMPDYAAIVSTHSRRARAKDFFDIYSLIERFHIDLLARENVDLLKACFLAKQVPLAFLGEMALFRDYHAQDYPSLKATVLPGAELREFDFYFDYVLGKVASLEPFGEVQPPPR